MHSFLNDDFLLRSEAAKHLYHFYAKDLPIIDYHNHLSPEYIAEDKQFKNITKAWLAGDHYKWRAMRTFGIDEFYITGKASDKDKFLKWAEVVPHTIRNPLFHWTHLELKNYFGINDLLSPTTAQSIWERTSDMLQEKSHSANGLLRLMKVESICTTDDPVDSLEFHAMIAKDSDKIKTLPTFRPDRAYAVENPESYRDYINELEKTTSSVIGSHNDLLAAMEKRVDFFHSHGCRLSDHGLEQFYLYDQNELNKDLIFEKVISLESLTIPEIRHYKMVTLEALSKMYHKRGWVQQFHLGAIRNNNQRLLEKLGPDTGFDSIGDFSQARGMSEFFNYLEKNNRLAKTIIYNLNPADNEVFISMTGNFNDGTTKGKMQFGSAWWFLDQKDGMERQLNALSNMGLLSCFVGMLTDSRSFLSFSRHEYFRRVLCNLIGNDVSNGELPNDMQSLGQIVANICYHNAKNYFTF